VISRRRCLHIAEQWQLNHGLQEYQRRREDVSRIPHLSVEHATKLHRGMAAAMLEGYYDPPFPKIPNFFQRLRINDWTPPEVDWPMNTEKAHERT
jgi:hypothetical protein